MGSKVLEYLWKTSLCALTYLIGIAAGGVAAAALGLELPVIPSAGGNTFPLVGLMVGCILLALSLGPVANRIRGGRVTRGLMLAAFAYVCLGLNTAIEASIFTTFGGTAALAVMPVVPCVLLGLVAAALFRRPRASESLVASSQHSTGGAGWQGWLWRIAAAVVSFPLIYFLFGMPVGLLVADYYRVEASGLFLPSLSVVIGTQFVRGVLYLLACLPVVLSWSGSRRDFILVFGIALFVFIGLFSMVQASWFPMQMRLIHTLELFADAMTYACVLAVLFRTTDKDCRGASAQSGAATDADP
jgi:hypothetical protein